MSEFDNKAGGALFPARKTTANQPDFTGEVTIDQELLEYLAVSLRTGKPMKLRLAGWRKTSKGGKDYLSILPSKVVERTETKPQPHKQASSPFDVDDDDEIPF